MAKEPELTLEQRKRMCTGKRLYVSLGAAEFAARRSTRTFKKRCRAYECPSCKFWHVTSQPSSGR